MKTCYLIGYPVGHSMSAVMHNAAFRALDLSFRFELGSVKPDELESFAKHGLRSPDARGASVTIPHKATVIRHLDELDPVAQRCGSVNTIVNDGGLLKGYNTDGLGAVRSLKESYGNLSGIKAVVIGAGGAARSICYHLSLTVGELLVLNRTLDKATGIIETLSKYPERRATLSAGPLSSAGEALKDADLVVNTTSMGMSPRIEDTPISGELLRTGLFVFDIVYNPPRTRLLREAKAAGSRTLNGIDMLVYQGAEAFKLWTGVDAPVDVMSGAVKDSLRAA